MKRLKKMKQRLAVLLAVLLMLPSQPFTVTATLSDGTVSQEFDQKQETEDRDESENEDSDQNKDESENENESQEEDKSENEDADPDEDESQEEDKSENEDADPDEDESENEDESQEEDKSENEDADPDEDESENEDESQEEDKFENEDADLDDSLNAEDEQEELIPEEDELPELIGEEIIFNTGNQPCTVVNESDFVSYEMGDVYFDEDGSYTIQIPEENPFFPYEVQFTYKDKVRTEWFMTPDDSVKLGDHIFYVNAEFDGTVVTQMSLEIAGDEVIVYPAKKEFTDGDGAEEVSLLPLEERDLTVDLSAYTPVELTMVAVDSIFTGKNQLGDSDKVSWSPAGEEEFQIVGKGDYLNLSCDTCYTDGTAWEMIVGDADQLAEDNVRYLVEVEVTESADWLLSSVFAETADGTRTELQMTDFGYEDYFYDDAEYWIDYYAEKELDEEETNFYLGWKINEELFAHPSYAKLKAYDYKIESLEEAKKAVAGERGIEDWLFAENLQEKQSGLLVEDAEFITLVAVDAAGQVMGYLPIMLSLTQNYTQTSAYLTMSLMKKGENGKESLKYTLHSSHSSGVTTRIFTLEPGYAVNAEYYLDMTCHMENQINNGVVTAAYLGNYRSIAEAEKQGAKDIKEVLFGEGYLADYSKGIFLTVFVGNDGTEEQQIFCYQIQTEAGSLLLSRNTDVYFRDLVDAEGNAVNAYLVDIYADSYAERNFFTMLVDDSVDLTALAPIFDLRNDNIHLYAEGSSTQEISGKSIHDFSDGAIQYTAAAENGTDSKNYWLQVIQEGSTSLYINSLADEEAETEMDGDVIYSVREMRLDNRYDYRHDILLINMDSDPIPNLSAELVSDQVELDGYWKLNGNYALAGFSGLHKTTSFGELANMAKLRIKGKEGVKKGSDISGTLTIKSGSTVLMVLTLTGTVGNPSIITTEIPEAVKYVPYGTMIQNSNRYSVNKVSYRISEGNLPNGMVLKSNGELYGVPKESGEFSFTVQMENSMSGFGSSWMDYTLVVAENTNSNVDNATDLGYELTQRVPNISFSSTEDYTLVSQGVYSEFEDVFLDGEKLTEGTDYYSESGSTRITIKSQTLKANGTPGTHTIGVEFRSGSNKELKRAAQNYTISEKGSSGGSSSGGSSSGNGTSKDATKGFMNTASGIVTGDGAGYSKWQQDGTGWKLLYADGTFAAGTQITLEDGSRAEQVLWEKINGRWYAFGANGELKAGWVYDYQLGSWYALSIENGMQSGWYTASGDGYTYYLDPETGKLAVGWKQIAHDWYLFNQESQGKTWLFDEKTGLWYYDILSKNKPLGAMYRSERTPDGYWVDENGAWDSKQ